MIVIVGVKCNTPPVCFQGSKDVPFPFEKKEMGLDLKPMRAREAVLWREQEEESEKIFPWWVVH